MEHILIAGLGNPGEEYDNTRHNIGFAVIDAIANHFEFPNFSLKFSSLTASKIIGTHKITLLKPQTFMNLSGDAVSKAANFYKITQNNIIIIHDDLDLELTKVKMKIAGGSGGHNGIKSIDQHIGLDYYRIRIGIGKPKFDKNVSGFVLSKFSKEEFTLINKAIESLVNNFDSILIRDPATLMNKLSIEYKNYAS